MKPQTFYSLLAFLLIMAALVFVAWVGLPFLTNYILQAWGISVPWAVLARTWAGIIGIYLMLRLVKSIV